MASANSPPDDVPLVLKTTSMYKIFQDVDALLAEAYAVIGKRPGTGRSSFSDESEQPFARVLSKPEKTSLEETIQKIQEGLTKHQKESPAPSSIQEKLKHDHSDSYETAGSEIDEHGNIKLKKKAAKTKVKPAVTSTTKSPRLSKSPSKGRNRVHTTKANSQHGDSEDDVVVQQAHKTKSKRAVGGDADNAVNMNDNELNDVILNSEKSPRPARTRRQNN